MDDLPAINDVFPSGHIRFIGRKPPQQQADGSYIVTFEFEAQPAADEPLIVGGRDVS